MAKPRMQVARLLSEFAVIVVGVLVAMAVDGWIADIDESQRERAYLTALRADFEENRLEAETRLAGEESVRELGLMLLEFLDGGPPSDPPARVVLATELSGYVARVSYARGAWEAMNSTGGSLSLSDPSLRVAVSNFYRRGEVREGLESEFLEYILAYRFQARSLLRPRVRIELNAAFGGWTGDFVSRSLDYLENVDLAPVVRVIRESTDLAVPLSDVVMARGVSASIMRRNLSEIDKILELIDAAIGAL